jgi:hypothetical protein
MTHAALSQPKRLPWLLRIANPRRAPLTICRVQPLSPPPNDVKSRSMRIQAPLHAWPEAAKSGLATTVTIAGKSMPPFKSP